jgi:signal transduction histidine kinase
MSVFSSLTNRIFFATALLAVLSTGVAIYFVNRAVTRQAESELQRGLLEAETLVDEYRTLLFDHFKREARLIADLPVIKAAAFETDVTTLEPIAKEYRREINADLLIITDRRGRVLTQLGAKDVRTDGLGGIPGIQQALKGREETSFWPEPHGILQIASVPIFIGRGQPETLGTLSVGVALDDRQASRFKALTNSEVAFGVNGVIQTATLGESDWQTLAPLLNRAGMQSITLNGNEFLAITKPLAPVEGGGQPMAIVLRSRTERLQFLRALHATLAGAAVVALIAAIGLSYAIARTVTRPLGTITSTMRDMTATGDLTRRIPLSLSDTKWQDEDARLLVTTFNAMTDSIERFQREATQRERLSSLGRLSTVVAHEIRNPLMIIKSGLRILRREDVKPEQVRGVAGDIDEEIARLNRIVAEVLDFARPIKFDLAPTDLNALARDAVRAADAGGADGKIKLDLDSTIPELTTDAERLRQALVNIVGNAIQAVDSREPSSDGELIRLRTAKLTTRRVAITVSDRGRGIAPEDLPRVFDPFFTTRRTGTGIGLAISRNIIEGLGGRITVSSERNRGTEVRIELPLQPPATA